MPFDESHGAAARLDRNRAIEVYMLEEDWDEFPQILREMLVAGLVARRDDGSYALTILGLLEVESDRTVHGRPSDSTTEGGHGAPAAARHANVFLIEPATSSSRE